MSSLKRVGIIGAGIRGQMFEGALREAPGVEVTGFAEPSERVRDQVAAATGLPVHPSHTELLAAGVDAVIVATPDFAHAGPVADAARAGADLLIEKPLATTRADLDAMRLAIETSGVRCLVGFENRWNPHFIDIQSRIERGDIGRVVTQSAELSNTTWVPTTMLSWAAKSSPMWFLMPHTVDLALWLASAAPTRVLAWGTRGVLAARGIDTWDTVHAVIEFADGSHADVASAWILPEGTPGIVEFAYRIVGEDGTIDAHLADQGLRVATGRYDRPWPVGGSAGGNLIGAPIWMARDWARMLTDDLPWGPGLDTGALVSSVILAAEASLTDSAWHEVG